MIRRVAKWVLVTQALALVWCQIRQRAEKHEQVIADAKKEGEVTPVASASTFGGRRALPSWKMFSPNDTASKPKLYLTGGPFPQVAARIIAEQKRERNRRPILSRFRRHLCDHGSGEGAGKSELVNGRESFLGDESDGNFPAGIGSGLCFVSRHHLQLELDSKKQSAEELRRFVDPALAPIRPRRVVGQDPDVQHVGVGEDEVRAPADGQALLALGVAVVDRGAHLLGQPEGVERARLVLGERLGRVEVERARLGVRAQDLERREVEAQRLAARRARGDDRRRLPRVAAVPAPGGCRAGRSRRWPGPARRSDAGRRGPPRRRGARAPS